MNPKLESPSHKIIENLSSNLVTSQSCSGLFTVQSQETDSDSSFRVKMESKLAGVDINWELVFNQFDNKSIKDYFVLPLMFNCAEYELRETELTKAVLAKDKEIDDYKSQGAKLSRSKYILFFK